MSKYTKITIGVLVVIIIAMALQFGGSNNNSDYKVGAVISLTGYGAVDGLNIKRGMDLAKEDLAKEGINIEIAYEDDATDPSKTVSSVQKFTSSADKPDVLVGPIWSFLIDAGLPVINQSKISSFSPCATSEVVNGDSDYMYYGTYKNIETAGVIEDWLDKNNVSKVAIVVSNDAWGMSNLEAFNNATANSGAKVVVTEKISFGSDRDVMPTIVAKIANSGAEAILWTGYDEAGTLIVKKVQEQHLNIPIVAAASVMRGLVERGNVTPTNAVPVYIVGIPMSEEFKAKFTAKYNEAPGTCADSAYDGIMILADALKKSEKKGVSLNEYLKNETNYDGYLGNYQFDQNGDIKDGKWEIRQLFSKVK